MVKCVLCNSNIEDEFGKLDGTVVRAVDEKKKGQLIYVCSSCMKEDDWVNKAKIKGA